MKANLTDSPTTREGALQKIIKNQEQIIQGLDAKLQKFREKGLPELTRLEQKLNDRDQEIELLRIKIKELQNGYNKEKTVLNQSTEKSKGDLEDLKTTLKFEKQKYERKLMQMEDHFKIKISSLENENKLVTEELVRLKRLYLKENDKDFSKQVNGNIKVLEDIKKLNSLFLLKETEHQGVIQQLKSKVLMNPSNTIFRGA